MTYNKLSIPQKDIDADLKELIENKLLISALKNSNTKFVVNKKIQAIFIASWTNIKLQALAYKELQEKENIMINSKDRIAAEIVAKKYLLQAM